MKLSRDLATPPGGSTVLHPRETIFTTGNLAAANAEVVIPVDGCASFAVDLRGTFSLTWMIEGTVDGTNWTTIAARPINQAAVGYVAAIAGTTQGIWVGRCAPFRAIRVRCSAFTSGTAMVTLVGDTATLDEMLQEQLTSGYGTNVGASGAAVTLTLTAPGAGLRHYLTYLRISRFAAAALTASATPVTITTTNLPGSMAFTCEAEAALQGTRASVVSEDFAYPVASSAQNTNTTIVCPATTGVIWRVSAGFYIAP